MERTEPGIAAASKGVNFEREVYCLLGLPIDALDMEGAVQRVRQAAFSNTRCFVSTVNVNFAMAARGDAAFRDSVLHSDLCLPDGMPLVWVARLLGLPIRERVSGAGLFERLLQQPGPPISIFFFGGPQGAAQAACRRVNEATCGLRCVGFDSPGFGSVEEMSGVDRIERINRSGAQFITVALGAKKGQAWIEHNRARLQAPVLCHLGAVVNYAAGTVRRAPTWVQALGAEWLWRSKQEPALWRRYWDDGASFLQVLLREVAPLAMQRRLRLAAATAQETARFTVHETPQRTLLKLRGAWVDTDLDPLRQALTIAQQRATNLALGLAGVSHVDSGFIALVMLARGGQARPGRLLVGGATPEVTNIFRRNGAVFLLKQDSE